MSYHDQDSVKFKIRSIRTELRNKSIRERKRTSVAVKEFVQKPNVLYYLKTRKSQIYIHNWPVFRRQISNFDRILLTASEDCLISWADKTKNVLQYYITVSLYSL